MLTVSLLAFAALVGAPNVPVLPETNGAIEVEAQEWPREPGPRTVLAYLYYPGEELDNIDETSGIFLSLHNWGGTVASGTADPQTLADKYNVIAVALDYVMSGPHNKENDPPYDFGLYQAIDALTVLHAVIDALDTQDIAIDLDRIYVTGGSGGGNVTLMANKLAPRTFTVAIDKCGMARLTDDIAYDLPGGSRLNAGYSRNPDSPRYLSPDAQAIRFVGHPDHVAAMKAMGATAKLFVVHGVDDDACLFVDAEEMVNNMKAAGLDVVPVYLTKDNLDGEIFKSSGHSLGDRTRIVSKVADEYLKEDPEIGRTINDMRMTVRYETPNGAYVVTYPEGRPLLTFEPKD